MAKTGTYLQKTKGPFRTWVNFTLSKTRFKTVCISGRYDRRSTTIALVKFPVCVTYRLKDISLLVYILKSVAKMIFWLINRLVIECFCW